MSENLADTRRSAKRAYKARDYDLALKLLAPLVAQSPTSPAEGAGDLTAYATALTAMSRLDEASEHMAKAVELCPDDPRMRAKYGEILARTGRHVEAAVQLKHLTELEPDVADNWVRLASEYNLLGQEAELEAALDRALAINPDHAEAQILQLERSLTGDPERDGMSYELDRELGRTDGADIGTAGAYGGPDSMAQERPPIRHRPWMVAVEAVALLLVALWIQSLL